MGRVELHFHLLPGVDDGPRDLATALELAREAVADGTELVVCTPHAREVDIAEVPERVRELRAALHRAGIDLQIEAGVELAWDDVATADGKMLEVLAHGPPGRRWHLLEAPLADTGDLEAFEDGAQELRDRGFGLLIGHPERSPEVVRSPGAVKRLLANGDRLQINGSSLTGYHGAGPLAAGLELVRSGRAWVIASDAHQPFSRGPALSAALDALRERGIDAEPLVSDRPWALMSRGLTPAQRLAA